MNKPIPDFRTDEEAERFVEHADLSEHDLAGFVRTTFEFEPKSAQLNMRLPRKLLDAVKTQARARGVPYTRLIRELLEQATVS